MYKVIDFFTDLQDNDHPYNVGDVFPHDGREVAESRIKELSSRENKQHKPLIAKVTDTTESIAEEKVDKPKKTAEPKKTASRKKQ